MLCCVPRERRASCRPGAVTVCQGWRSLARVKPDAVVHPMYHSLLLLSRSEGTLLFGHYMVSSSVEEQDAWECAVACATRQLLRSSWGSGVGGGGGGGDVCLTASGLPLVARVARDVVFLLAGERDTDELALADALDVVVRLADAVCDRALSAAQVVAFHGKLAVSMHEAFFCGELLLTDVEMVLRQAKLKAPAA